MSQSKRRKLTTERDARSIKLPCSHCGQILSLVTVQSHFQQHWDFITNTSWRQVLYNMPIIPVHHPLDHINRSIRLLSEEAILSMRETDNKLEISNFHNIPNDVLEQKYQDSPDINSGEHADKQNQEIPNIDELFDTIDFEEMERLDSKVEIQNLDYFIRSAIENERYNDDIDDEDNNLCFAKHKFPLVVVVFLFFMKFWQTRFKISKRAFNSLFYILSFFWNESSTISEHWIVKKHSNVSRRIDRLLGLKKYGTDHFKRFCVCKKCHSLYRIDALPTNVNFLCPYINDPNHPTPKFRIVCDQELLRPFGPMRNITWKPEIIYCYRTLKSSISQFVLRPNFLKQIEEWRTWIPVPGVSISFWDGDEWKKCMPVDTPLGTIQFLLHVDWISVSYC